MNFRKPFFSVVIPLYNKEAYIADTLRSVLNQSFSDFELFVVNDGSTDKSAEIVRSFSDSRLKLYSKINGGVSCARNYGVRNAACKYIAFLDADDQWEPDYLAEMKRMIDLYPSCGFYASAYNMVEDSWMYHIGKNVPEGIIPDYFKTELKHEITRLSATVVSKPVFQQAGCFPVGMLGGEDSYFCARIAINFPVAFTPKPLVKYNKKFSGKAFRYDKADSCQECWSDLYAEGEFYRNELIADKAIKAGIRYALGFQRQKSLEIEKLTSYTKLSKSRWRYLHFLNQLPERGIALFKKLKPYYSNLKAMVRMQ